MNEAKAGAFLAIVLVLTLIVCAAINSNQENLQPPAPAESTSTQ